MCFFCTGGGSLSVVKPTTSGHIRENFFILLSFNFFFPLFSYCCSFQGMMHVDPMVKGSGDIYNTNNIYIYIYIYIYILVITIWGVSCSRQHFRLYITAEDKATLRIDIRPDTNEESKS